MLTINSLLFQSRLFVQIFLLILCCFCAPAIFASTSLNDNLNYSDLAKLASLETIVYGTSYKSLPSEKRVYSLEKLLFGKTHKGDLHQRILALANVVNGKSGNVLEPPLAPEFDHSNIVNNNSMPPPTAPRTVSESDDGDIASPSEAQQDRIKNMLQHATQLYSQNQVAAAETIFKNILSLDRQNADANFNLGAISEGRGDWQTALLYYEAALKSSPNDPEARAAVQSMKNKIAQGNQKQFQSAQNHMSANQIETLRKQVAQAANDYQKGNYDSAINTLNNVLQQAPNQPDVLYALSQAYKAKGQYSLARSTLAQAVSINPDNQEYKDALSELDQKIANGQGDNGQLLADQYSSNAPAGEITPFSQDNDSSAGWQSVPSARFFQGGNGYSVGYGQGPMSGYTYSNYKPYGTVTRIERAAIGSLTGAAIGSMFSGYGYRGSGAMTGAMIGGLFGLMGGRW